MLNEFIFIRDGKQEKVKPERWGWGVIYKDGTELHQFGEDGIFHQFKEINQEWVKLFVMYRLDDMSKRYDLPVFPEMKLIHFYRHLLLSAMTPDETRYKVYIFGYEKNVNGKNEKVLIHIMPDDRTLISDQDNIDLANFMVPVVH